MNLKIISICMLNLIALNGRSAAETQAPPKQPDCLMHEAHLRWHDGTMESVEGRIVDVAVDSSCPGYRAVLHFKVQGADGEYLVNVGPVSYLNPSRLRFAIGDEIKINGALFESQGQKILVASEIEKNGKKTILRDHDGHPLWHLPMKQKEKVKNPPGMGH